MGHYARPSLDKRYEIAVDDLRFHERRFIVSEQYVWRRLRPATLSPREAPEGGAADRSGVPAPAGRLGPRPPREV